LIVEFGGLILFGKMESWMSHFMRSLYSRTKERMLGITQNMSANMLVVLSHEEKCAGWTKKDNIVL
jgi:hypothetical protein